MRPLKLKNNQYNIQQTRHAIIFFYNQTQKCPINESSGKNNWT